MKRIMMILGVLIFALLSAQESIPPTNYTEADAGTLDNPYQIASWQNLLWLSENYAEWAKNYIQTNHITFPENISVWNNNTGWIPVGNITFNFTGTYNGNGYSISGIYVKRQNKFYQGFFGVISHAQISNLFLNNAMIIANECIGGIAGYNNQSIIDHCSFSGNLSANKNAGGLVGLSDGIISNSSGNGLLMGNVFAIGGIAGINLGTISNCKNSIHLSGNAQSIGGLAGRNEGSIDSSDFYGQMTVSNSYVGGIAGYNSSGTINRSINTGNINGYDYVGGLVGWDFSGVITNSFNTGSIVGNSATGGLEGYHSMGSLTNSYSAGEVSGYDYTGGLIGYCDTSVLNCYSIGSVTGVSLTGGLTGYNSNIISNSFWNMETSGQTTSAGGTGLSTVQMKSQSTFTDAGWSFPEIWAINPELNEGYPYLNYPNAVQINDISVSRVLDHKAILHSAYPNPFNPSTTIAFDLASPSEVKIEIYNVKGQLVKNLVHKAYLTGSHTIVWDGRDHEGNNCGTGVYFYKMTAGKTVQTKKMMMIK